MTCVSPKVLDPGKICRLCLSDDDDLVSIFGEDESLDDERPSLIFKLRVVTPIEVSFKLGPEEVFDGS